MLIPALLLLFPPCILSYDLVHSYQGSTFFDDWDFYGSWDNLTLGDVWWLNREDSFAQRLAYVNPAGNAIIRVDNTSDVPFNEKRNTVRITSKHAYGVGSLWVIDLRHIPYGCSVWPAAWTKGPTWPDNGEIDIVEGINTMNANQMALHTLPGCFAPSQPMQSGKSIERDCSQPSGCTVGEAMPNSWGSEFAAAGGGIFATQFDVSGIYIWFFSRPSIPHSLLDSDHSSSLVMSDWGLPSAAYPSNGCDITNFFSPQNLVLDITLCGNWAGDPKNYLPGCANQGQTGTCYADNVVGPGSPRYDNAYFEVEYIRAYTTGGIVPSPTAPVAAGQARAGSNSADANKDITAARWWVPVVIVVAKVMFI